MFLIFRVWAKISPPLVKRRRGVLSLCPVAGCYFANLPDLKLELPRPVAQLKKCFGFQVNRRDVGRPRCFTTYLVTAAIRRNKKAIDAFDVRKSDRERLSLQAFGQSGLKQMATPIKVLSNLFSRGTLFTVGRETQRSTYVNQNSANQGGQQNQQGGQGGQQGGQQDQKPGQQQTQKPGQGGQQGGQNPGQQNQK